MACWFCGHVIRNLIQAVIKTGWLISLKKKHIYYIYIAANSSINDEKNWHCTKPSATTKMRKEHFSTKTKHNQIHEKVSANRKSSFTLLENRHLALAVCQLIYGAFCNFGWTKNSLDAESINNNRHHHNRHKKKPKKRWLNQSKCINRLKTKLGNYPNSYRKLNVIIQRWVLMQ